MPARNQLANSRRVKKKANPEKELDDLIRRVFMSNGFTVKCGESDLKPYVYKAAKELLTELKLIQPNL